jgi:hypothetical protein
MYVGSLPVHWVPFLSAYAREQFVSRPVPEDVLTAWKKVAKVTVAAGTLQLTMP